MPKLTPQERRARIRTRLKQAEEPKGSVEQTTDDVATESKSVEQETVNPPAETPAPQKPTTGSIRQRVLEKRQDKPANYKLHVVTALSLALLVRIAAFGAKAIFGGEK